MVQNGNPSHHRSERVAELYAPAACRAFVLTGLVEVRVEDVAVAPEVVELEARVVEHVEEIDAELEAVALPRRERDLERARERGVELLDVRRAQRVAARDVPQPEPDPVAGVVRVDGVAEEVRE